LALLVIVGFHAQEKGTRRLLKTRKKKYKKRQRKTGREKCSIVETTNRHLF